MEANNDNNSSQSQQLEDKDRLSTLTDDILLSILGRLSSRMAARTSMLSTRWMHLPWLLPEISIDVKEFLSGPRRDPAEENDMDQAMSSLTKATRSFLAKPRKGSSISRLRLQLYLINTFLCDIGPLVGDAINSGLLKDLDLTIHDETCPLDRTEEEMTQRAQEMDGFFTAYPTVLRCLTRLCLYNLWMPPEIKELCPAFNKIRKLSVRGIFVDFDIDWTIAFLEAAPSVEILLIGVWDHACESVEDDSGQGPRSTFPERRNPRWEMDFHSSKNMLLKELHFVGFASYEHQFTFIRALLERAPNLERIVLKGNEQCDQCDALDPPPESLFPREKDEQEMAVRRIMDGIFSPQIIFDE